MPSAFFGGGGGGGAYCAEATAHFARCASLTDAIKGYLNTLIEGLKADGIWSLLDVLIVCTNTEADSRLNLCSSSFDITNVGGCAFVGSQGWTTSATGSKYLNSNYTIGAVGTSTSINLASAFSYRRTNSFPSVAYDFGAQNSSSTNRFNIGHTSPTKAAWIANSSSSDTVVNVTSVLGFNGISRSSAPGSTLYCGGSSYWDGKASTSIPVYPLFVGALNHRGSPMGFSENQYACFGVGSFDSTALVAIASRLQTYMTSLGTAV